MKRKEPVPGAPYEVAIELRDSITRQQKGLLGTKPGSRMHLYQEAEKSLFFDPRMEKFWLGIRKKEPTSSFKAFLKQQDKPLSDGYVYTSMRIAQMAMPPPQYTSQDSKTLERDRERVTNSLRHAAQVLKSTPYYDVIILALLDTEFIKHELDRALARLYDPITEDAVEEIEDFVSEFSESLPEFALYAGRASKKTCHAPESLSDFLTKLCENIDNLPKEENTNTPRPNNKNARIIGFCRDLDQYLKGAFDYSSPTQVANCASVVLHCEVTAEQVKRWRLPANKKG